MLSCSLLFPSTPTVLNEFVPQTYHSSAGYQLQPLPNDNYRILGLPEEIHVKQTYWICTDDGGNPIDLLMRIRNLPFNQAMRLLCDTASRVELSPS